jgi:hypothetical protein
LLGTVREEASGRPVAGVLIVVENLEEIRALTDSAGAYRIPALTYGSYTVTARKIGYYIERREIAASCPVVIVDTAGRPIGGGGPCDPDPQLLNFHLRPHTLR